jgi:uncharacterized protein (TIGR03032 family)
MAHHGEQPPMADPADSKAPAQSDETIYREIQHEYTLNLPALLSELRISLLVSTYQAGKLVLVAVDQGQLVFSFHSFLRAMGVAVRPDRIAVGAQNEIWFLRGAPELAPRTEPLGRRDGCFLASSAHFTGDIQAHELTWIDGELWIVNTLFSCLSTLREDYSFVPRWRPPFVTALAAEDRCHLNGAAVVDGRVKYVTALGETNTHHGWRPSKVTSGCLIDVDSGAAVARGFAMPHSPRLHAGRVWLLNSGFGKLMIVDPASGKAETVVALPGYTRGLALVGSYAFVGLSKIRETSTFGGMPIAERLKELKCGVGVVDLTTGRLVGHLEFKTGVDEIFDVQVLHGMCFPMISGPLPQQDGGAPIWTVPDPQTETRGRT